MSKMCPYHGECMLSCDKQNKRNCFVKKVISQRNNAEEAYLNMQEIVIEMEAKMEKMTLDISKMAKERAYAIYSKIDELTLANIPTETLKKLIEKATKELNDRTR